MKPMKAIAVIALVLMVVGIFLAVPACVPTYSLVISVVGQGTTDPTAGEYTYRRIGGIATLTITATPSAGWQFDSWSGDASGTSPFTTLTMDSNKAVTANFKEAPQLPLTPTPTPTP